MTATTTGTGKVTRTDVPTPVKKHRSYTGLAAGLAYVEAQRRARGRTPPRPVSRRRNRRIRGAARLSTEPAMPSMAKANRA